VNKLSIILPFLVIISSLNLGGFFFSYQTKTKYLPYIFCFGFIACFLQIPFIFKITILTIIFSLIIATNSLYFIVNFLSGFLLYCFFIVFYFYLLNIFNFFQLLDSESPWFILFFICNIVAILTRFFLIKTNHTTNLFKNTKNNIGFVLTCELLLLIGIYALSTKRYSPLFDQLLSVNPYLLIGLVLLTLLTFIILLYSLYRLRTNLKIIKQTKEQQQLLQNYVNEIKAQKHDFNSHLSTIQYLNTSKQYIQLSEYISNMINEYDAINQSMITSVPELSALLFEHEKKAKKMNVQLNFFLQAKIETLPITLYQLNKLLGNLLANAIEAATQTDEREVSLLIKKKEPHLIFVISNSGQIDQEIFKNMFKPNQTTKPNPANHGYGLYIVNQIVKEANGRIDFATGNRNVICTVQLPLFERRKKLEKN
jgi:two-component system sensor histidine kinase AgrC